MPGDTLSGSISFLDVQFGALEFGCDTNINEISKQDKYITIGIKPLSMPSAESSSTSMEAVNSLSIKTAQTSNNQKSNSTTRIVSQCFD